jgi:hypothetical protein
MRMQNTSKESVHAEKEHTVYSWFMKDTPPMLKVLEGLKLNMIYLYTVAFIYVFLFHIFTFRND